MANEEIAAALLQAAASINPYNRNPFGNLAQVAAAGVGGFARQKQANQTQGMSYEQLAQYWADKDPEKARQYLEMAQSMQPKQKEAFAKQVAINPETGEAEVVIVYRDGSREFTGLKPEYETPARAVRSSSAPGRLPTGYMWDESNGRAVPIPGVPQKPVGGVRQSRADAPDSGSRNNTMPQDDGLIPMPTGKVTQEQRSTLGYADRMLQAEKALAGVQGGEPTEKTEIAGSIPLVGGYMRRLTQSDSQQQFSNLANEWIRAKLRKESGAAIGIDEMQKEFETYFPQPGDSAAVIEQKERLRQNALQSMARQAGSSLPARPEISSQEVSKLPPASKHPGAIYRDTKYGKRFRSNGKTWEQI